MDFRDRILGHFIYAATTLPEDGSQSGCILDQAHREWAVLMATLRTHIVLPEQLAKDIDKIAGPRGRSAFLVKLAESEVRRRKLLAFLDSDTPAWRDEDHPELAEMGTAEWVRSLRSEPSTRLAGRDENLDPE
jgi:hypothetical protein